MLRHDVNNIAVEKAWNYLDEQIAKGKGRRESLGKNINTCKILRVLLSRHGIQAHMCDWESTAHFHWRTAGMHPCILADTLNTMPASLVASINGCQP